MTSNKSAAEIILFAQSVNDKAHRLGIQDSNPDVAHMRFIMRDASESQILDTGALLHYAHLAQEAVQDAEAAQ